MKGKGKISLVRDIRSPIGTTFVVMYSGPAVHITAFAKKKVSKPASLQIISRRAGFKFIAGGPNSLPESDSDPRMEEESA